MIRKDLPFLALLLCVLTLLIACNNEGNKSASNVDTTIVVSLSEAEIDSIRQGVEEMDTSALSVIKMAGAKSKLEKAFIDMYNACLKADDNPKPKFLVFYSTSNLNSVGSVFSSNGKSLINGFYQCFLEDGKIDSIKAEKELKKFTQFNNLSVCDVTETKNFSLSLLLGAAVKKYGDANLSTEISKSDSIVMRAASWQKIALFDSLFARYLDSSTRPSIMQLKNDVRNKSHVVLAKVYKISGFAGEIYKNKDFGAELTGQLNGKTIEIPLESTATTDTTGKIKFKLNMDAANKKIIKVSSSGDFYVFGFYTKFSKHD